MTTEYLLFAITISIISQSNASESSRSDFVVELQTANEQDRGDWSTTIYCNEGHYGIGYSLKVEPYQGNVLGLQDDSAANGLKLDCSDSETIQADIDGDQGTYGSSILCTNHSLIIGYTTRVEGDCNCGDQTSLNDVEAQCDDNSNTFITTTNGLTFGTWSNYVYCPAYSAICGFRQRVRNAPGAADDTAVNAIRFQCCKVPTMSPTSYPSRSPIASPTFSPSSSPTNSPTFSPSSSPTKLPTANPSNSPTMPPSNAPTSVTSFPTIMPTFMPTYNPSNNPTTYPTIIPTVNPTSIPTLDPTLPEGQQDDHHSSTTELMDATNAIKQQDEENGNIAIILSVIGVFVCILICISIYFGRNTWKKGKSMEREQQQHIELKAVSMDSPVGSLSNPESIINARSVSNARSISQVSEEQKMSHIEDNGDILMGIQTNIGIDDEGTDNTDNTDEMNDNVDDDDDDIIKITDDGNGDNIEITDSNSDINDIKTPKEPKDVVDGISDDAFVVYGDDEIIDDEEGGKHKETVNGSSSDDEIVKQIDTMQ